MKINKVMKKIIFLLIGVFLFAFGCNNEILDTDSALETVDLKLEAVNLKYSKTKMVPIKGEASIAIDEYDTLGLGIKGKMSGYFSHLGKLNAMKSTWENVIHDLSQFPPMITFIQDVSFCAANGDLLHAIYTGVVDVTTSEVIGSCVFEGGTGRFEYASGQMYANGYASYDQTGLIIGMYLAGEGKISY